MLEEVREKVMDLVWESAPDSLKDPFNHVVSDMLAKEDPFAIIIDTCSFIQLAVASGRSVEDATAVLASAAHNARKERLQVNSQAKGPTDVT